jgi:predicted signal transduction protein with EAL and GGDEF domain
VEAATAALRLNHLRETVENIQLPFEGLSVHITLSIGISVYPNNGATLDDLINKADKALYKAKDAGRNRVFCFEESQNPYLALQGQYVTTVTKHVPFLTNQIQRGLL